MIYILPRIVGKLSILNVLWLISSKYLEEWNGDGGFYSSLMNSSHNVDLRNRRNRYSNSAFCL